MTRLATARELARPTQLPVSAYFDTELFEHELRTLFADGPGYVGHDLMVPVTGDYYALAWRDNAQALVRNAQGVELLSNICRHRQAIMLKGKGNARNIVCPLHRWTYGLDGKLIGAPHFPENPCLHLGQSPLQRWNGLLFHGKRNVAEDLAAIADRRDFDFEGYMLHRIEVHECNYNWKSFIEVYLEDYHVEPFHPGLGQFVSCDDLDWQFGEWFSVQTVGINNRLARPGSKTYQRWHQAVLDYYQGEMPRHGAIWLTYYPNVMVEWYPHVLVVSTLHPRAVDRTTNVVEFYYPEDIALFEPEFVEAEHAAYMETCAEDDEIAERMDEGRLALHRAGRNEVGPYQSPFEDGMRHFHQFYRAQMGDLLKFRD
jgi:phenylpropionate dioxygenase-like ring-hydroxylating dioxygenase large terminal subunit